MLKNKVFRIIVLTLAALMLLSFTIFAEETPEEDTILNFGIFSDIHNQAGYMANTMNNFETLAGGNENIDGIVMVGDIAYLGSNDIPNASTYDIIHNNEDVMFFKDAGKLVFAMGNHEFPMGSSAEDISALSRQVFTEQVGQAPESHTVLNGYHFITAGPDRYDGTFSAEQEQYVMDEITKALEDGEDKPIFFFVHHPLDDTLYDSAQTRHSTEFVNFLKAQPRVISFSGHMHYSISDPRSIYQVKGGATFMYTSSVHGGGNNLSNFYATQQHDLASPSQAYIMQIDSATNVVTLKRFYVDATSPTYIESDDWVLDIPKMVAESKKAEEEIDTENVYKYTYEVREANSVKPVYDANDKITLTEMTNTQLTVTYPCATPGAEGEDNYVGYYKIDLYNKRTGETKTKKLISDYFLKNKRTSYSCSFDTFLYDEDYTIIVTPVNMWFVEGDPIELDITTNPPPFGFGKISGYDDTYYATEATINGAGDGLLIDYENAFQLTPENNKRLVGLYAVSNDEFNTYDIVYVYGSIGERRVIFERNENSKLIVASSGGKGVFIPGTITSSEWIGAPGTSDFSTDSQWNSAFVKNYFSATDDPEGTEGGQTAAEKRLTILRNQIASLNVNNRYWAYAYTKDQIIPVSEVGTFKFGFKMNSVYKRAEVNINNATFRYVAYVIDKDGNVTTHAVNKSGAIKTTGYTYATVDFKADEWEIPFPEEGYLVGFRIYPYYGLSDSDVSVTATDESTAAASGDTIRYVASVSTYTIDIPKAPMPTGITVEGTTFNGLDKDVTYSVAPYYVTGADSTKAIEISGDTSYTLPEGSVGLYGIYVKGDGIDTKDSDAYIVYVRGSYVDRYNITELWEADDLQYDGVTPVDPKWIGKLKHASKDAFIPGFMSQNTTTYTGYGNIGIMADGHFSVVNSNKLWDAIESGDDDELAAAHEALYDNGHKFVIRYALTDEEIIPISEVNHYTFDLKRDQGTFNLTKNTTRFDAYVMDEKGQISIHTCYFDKKIVNYATDACVVDFTTSVGWETPLPKDGYFVGYAVYPFWDIGPLDSIELTLTTRPASMHNTRAIFSHIVGGYSIDIPTLEAPKGITVDENTFKGLDADKTYTITPYTIVGADEESEITVTGVTSYTLPADAKGLYGIYFKSTNDEYTDSDLGAMIYIHAPYEERKILGTNNDSGDPAGVESTEADKEWETPGVIAGGDWYTSTKAFKCDWVYYLVSPKELMDADDTGDTEKAQALRETAKNALAKISYRYAFECSDISPIEDVVTMKFSRSTQNSDITVRNAASRLILYVMGTDGKLSTYSATSAIHTNSGDAAATENEETFDIQSIEGLPKEGYLVAYKYYPYYIVNAEDIVGSNSTQSHFSPQVRTPSTYHTSNYVLNKSKTKAPNGITTMGTVISGLNSQKTYKIATYTVEGKDTENIQTITGVTTVDIRTLFENPVGLYGLYFEGDAEFLTSDSTIIYVPGVSEDREEIGVPATIYVNGNYYDGVLSYASNINTDPTYMKYDLVWTTGLYSGYRSYYNRSGNYFYFSNDWSARGNYTANQLKEALETEDTADELVIQQAYQKLLEKQTLRYSYLPEEIIPVDQLLTMSYSAFSSHGKITPQVRAKLNVYVMAPDSTITVYSALSDKYIPTGSAVSCIFDIQSIKGLPKQGWVVATEFLPAGEVALEDIVSTSTSTDRGFEVSVIPGVYKIAKAEAPVVERTDSNQFTITNLSEGFDYEYAISDTNESAPETGWTAVTDNTVTVDGLGKFVWVKRLANNKYEAETVVSDMATDSVKFTSTNLVLDGIIGIKVTFEHAKGITGATLDYTLVNNGSTSYQEDITLDATGRGSFILPMLAKNAGSAHYEAKLSYSGANGDESISLSNLSVYDMVERYQTNPTEYADVLPLINALETYYLAVTDYFNTEITEVEALADLTTEELNDLDSKVVHKRTGAVAGLEFHSTSLILEEDTTIRHYFKVAEGTDLASYTVAGGTALQLATGTEEYAYTDITSIASNELSTAYEVTVIDKNTNSITINFNALAYVDLCLENEDAKLKKLVKALYRYSVESDNYMA